MTLADALLPGGRGVVAFVGAGGKTRAQSVMAAALRDQGRSVLMSTTTHWADPRVAPMAADEVIPSPALAAAPSRELERPPAELRGSPGPPGRVVAVLSTEAGEDGRVCGVHPSWIPLLAPGWDAVLVEADGSRCMPVKAPAPHEPALPAVVDVVVGVIGLSCLGRRMDALTVHRLERFAAVTGCAEGEPIRWEHLEALIRHPQGLFKAAGGARRVLLLNQADRAPVLPSRTTLEAVRETTIVAALGFEPPRLLEVTGPCP